MRYPNSFALLIAFCVLALFPCGPRAAESEVFCANISKALDRVLRDGGADGKENPWSALELLESVLPPGGDDQHREPAWLSGLESNDGDNVKKIINNHVVLSDDDANDLSGIFNEYDTVSVHYVGGDPPLFIAATEHGTGYCGDFFAFLIRDGKAVRAKAAEMAYCLQGGSFAQITRILGHNVMFWERSSVSSIAFEVRDLDARPPGTTGCRGQLTFTRKSKIADRTRCRAPVCDAVIPHIPDIIETSEAGKPLPNIGFLRSRDQDVKDIRTAITELWEKRGVHDPASLASAATIGSAFVREGDRLVEILLAGGEHRGLDGVIARRTGNGTEVKAIRDAISNLEALGKSPDLEFEGDFWVVDVMFFAYDGGVYVVTFGKSKSHHFDMPGYDIGLYQLNGSELVRVGAIRTDDVHANPATITVTPF